MKLQFISGFGVCLLLQSCIFTNHKVVIDNPGEVPISVVLNRDSFYLTPKHFMELSLPTGEYELSVYGSDSSINALKKRKIYIKDGGLLNVSRNSYVNWRDIFIRDPKHSEKYTKLLRSRIITLGGAEYYGDLELYGPDSLFIPQRWDLWLDEEFVSTKILYKPYMLQSKLFRQEEFELNFNRVAR